jgi:hypothetical protein
MPCNGQQPAYRLARRIDSCSESTFTKAIREWVKRGNVTATRHGICANGAQADSRERRTLRLDASRIPRNLPERPMLSNPLLAVSLFRAPEAHLPTEEPENPHRPPPPPVPDSEPPPVPQGDPPPEAPPERVRLHVSA